VTCEITTGSELEFKSEIWLVAGLPTVTEPNATVAGDAVTLPALEDPVDVLFGTRPPQPERAMQPLRTIDTAMKYESLIIGNCCRELDGRRLLCLLLQTG
jgi:hypothetical protein